jgi:hypothetical protein
MNECERSIMKMALDYDLPVLLKYCSENEGIDRYACKNDKFWRLYTQEHYKGIHPPGERENAKQYLYFILDQIKLEPFLLPNNPQSRTIASRMGLFDSDKWKIYHEADRAARNINNMKKFCERFYNYCSDDEFWQQMFKIFYSHIKGDPSQYIKHHLPNMSWRDAYIQVKNTPSILQSGFILN